MPFGRFDRELVFNAERSGDAVFTLIGQGLGPRDIARQLTVSVKTVETHQARIKEKLGLTHVRDLTRAAVSWSLQ